MKSTALTILLLSFFSLTALAQDRTVVATVDSKPIYLDEIGGSEDSQQGEIKFVDPGVGIEGTDFNTQTTLLRKRIIDQLLISETERRDLSPPEELVTKEVNAYADRQWRLLFPTNEKKKEVLERMQTTGLKILEGLKIWNTDKKKGDEFAKLELEPLGMTPEAWTFYTDHSNDPEILGKLQKWEDIDSMSDDDIKEFLFLTNNQQHRENIKLVLARELLKKQVTQGVSISDQELERLRELVYDTHWIDIIIIPGGSLELKKLRALPQKEREAQIPQELMSNKLRLPKNDSDNSSSNISSLNELMVLASYSDSLDPGTLSYEVDWPENSKDEGSFVIYIVDKKEKEEALPPKTIKEAELDKSLLRFKRDREFSKWLEQQIMLRTKILIPEYNSAIRN